MPNRDANTPPDPYAALLEVFIAAPHEWLALQRYGEASGRPHWEPGAGRQHALPLDPLSELMLGATVAGLLGGDADDAAGGDADDANGTPLEERCDHTFTLTAACLRDLGIDKVAMYQQLVERDIFCDHEMVEQLLFLRGASLAALVEGWVAGGERAVVDRLADGKVVEISPGPPDAEVLAEGPLAGSWVGNRFELHRQLLGGVHLMALLDAAADLLRDGERLVLGVAFPYEDDTPPVVAVAARDDVRVVSTERRFEEDALERDDHQRLDTLLPALRRHRPPPPRGGGSLPSETDEAWVIDRLAELMKRHGNEPVLRPPLMDLPFAAGELEGEDGVRQVLRFLMNAAGLEPLALHLRLAPYADVLAVGGIAHPHGQSTSTLGWFEGIEGDRCVFGVDLSQHWDLEGLVGTLSHEVAHAWRHHHGLIEDDPVEEELLTDLTTHYLGFGLYTTNTSRRLRTWADWSAQDFTSHQLHEKAGYLPPVLMSFTLALTAAARGGDRKERRRLARSLETDQRSYFKAAAAYLDGADERVQALGLGPRRQRAPLRERNISHIGPFAPRDTVEVWERDDDPAAADREPVFGMRDRRPTAITWLTLAAGVAGTIALGTYTELGFFAFLIGLAWVFVAYLFGPGTRCHLCTVCAALLDDADTTCPGCGGHIHGRVRDGYEWLEAKERLEGTYDEQ